MFLVEDIRVIGQDTNTDQETFVNYGGFKIPVDDLGTPSPTRRVVLLRSENRPLLDLLLAMLASGEQDATVANWLRKTQNAPNFRSRHRHDLDRLCCNRPH